MRDQGDGVDSVRQRRDVLPSCPFRQPLGLDGIEQVAEENRDRCAGQNPSVHEIGWEPEDEPAQRVDQKQLDEVVEREAEEPVDVAAYEPGHGGKV